jgi:hypothetical protein
VITREDQVEQSVSDYVREQLVAFGYPEDKVHVREAFPSPEERGKELTQTVVAVGFNFDDGGRRIEMGSTLTQRVYNIEFWTFGINQNYGRNVANVIRAILEGNDFLIPLKAIEQEGQPVIDKLIIQDFRGIQVQRQVAHEPRPWDRHVFTTTVKVEDTYFPNQSLVASP